MLMFDHATALDVLDALRLLEGRLRGSGRTLSAGALELRAVAERSRRVTTVQPPPPPQLVGDDPLMTLWTLDEAAERLSVSSSTAKRLVASGELASVRIGRARRVRPVDVGRYLERSTEQGGVCRGDES